MEETNIEVGVYYSPKTNIFRAFSESPAPVPEGFYLVAISTLNINYNDIQTVKNKV